MDALSIDHDAGTGHMPASRRPHSRPGAHGRAPARSTSRTLRREAGGVRQGDGTLDPRRVGAAAPRPRPSDPRRTARRARPPPATSPRPARCRPSRAGVAGSCSTSPEASGSTGQVPVIAPATWAARAAWVTTSSRDSEAGRTARASLVCWRVSGTATTTTGAAVRLRPADDQVPVGAPSWPTRTRRGRPARRCPGGPRSRPRARPGRGPPPAASVSARPSARPATIADDDDPSPRSSGMALSTTSDTSGTSSAVRSRRSARGWRQTRLSSSVGESPSPSPVRGAPGRRRGHRGDDQVQVERPRRGRRSRARGWPWWPARGPHRGPRRGDGAAVVADVGHQASPSCSAAASTSAGSTTGLGRPRSPSPGP